MRSDPDGVKKRKAFVSAEFREVTLLLELVENTHIWLLCDLSSRDTKPN